VKTRSIGGFSLPLSSNDSRESRSWTLSGAVEEAIGADLLQDLLLVGHIDRRDLAAESFGDLDRVQPDAASSSDDQDVLTRLQLGELQEVQRVEVAERTAAASSELVPSGSLARGRDSGTATYCP
jgi:hypothetical protein